MRGLAPQLEETRCFSNLAAWQQIFSLSFVQRGTFLLPAAAKMLLDFFGLFVLKLRREIGAFWICKQKTWL